MTTTIKVSAHCSEDKEVNVSIADSVSGNIKENVTIQNGETLERVVYDDLVLSVCERKK